MSILPKQVVRLKRKHEQVMNTFHEKHQNKEVTIETDILENALTVLFVLGFSASLLASILFA